MWKNFVCVECLGIIASIQLIKLLIEIMLLKDLSLLKIVAFIYLIPKTSFRRLPLNFENSRKINERYSLLSQNVIILIRYIILLSNWKLYSIIIQLLYFIYPIRRKISLSSYITRNKNYRVIKFPELLVTSTDVVSEYWSWGGISSTIQWSYDFVNNMLVTRYVQQFSEFWSKYILW